LSSEGDEVSETKVTISHDRTPVEPVSDDLRKAPRWADVASSTSPHSNVSVALVSMPFASLTSPSIQLGLLKRVAERAGFAAEALYLGFDLARVIGPDLYQAIADPNPQVHREHFVTFGEWLFSNAAFLDEAPDANHGLLSEYNEDVDALITDALTRREDRRLKFSDRGEDPGTECSVGSAYPDVTHDLLVHIREELVPKYLDDVVKRPLWESVAVVGFTSTFEQNVASFALARMLKAARPNLTVVFGGSNLEADMGHEWFRTMPFIDYVVSGDGEAALVHLLAALASGREPEPLHGLFGRRQVDEAACPPRTVLRDLDSLPVPDYGDFYQSAAESGFFGKGGGLEASITFETSRGCWWGERRHCTFCGLNGLGMSFRAKSGERVLSEFAELVAQYEASPLSCMQPSRPLLFCADNILPMQYFDDVLPALSAANGPYSLFYEVKANLSRERIQLMRDAGITVIQPGIESLNSHVLQLIRKGTRAIHNVNCLRWARYYRLLTAWNIIYGFPGESVQDYDSQAALIPLLRHLQPPQVCGPVRMDRFSPLFEDTADYPTLRCTPMRTYGYTYPTRVRLDRTAYFFEHEFVDALPGEVYAPVRQAVQDWEQLWRFSGQERPLRPPAMTFDVDDGMLRIDDRRTPSERCEHVVGDSLAAGVYDACSERPVTSQEACRRLPGASRNRIQEICEDLTSRGLMMRDGNLFLSLALPSRSGLQQKL
jgi:ribosomal peptide maturation radical SAM protein 1